MGDVIHNLPVATDIRRQFPDAIIDWVVEESFAQVPVLHPGVRNVIPVALRRWRKSLTSPAIRQELSAFRSRLRMETYDVILDTQGLVKSALIASLARGDRRGYGWNSAREPIASCFYQHRFSVEKTLHAVERNRLLAAKALNYDLESLALDYGVKAPAERPDWLPDTPYAVLLHATSRDDKLWLENNWITLGHKMVAAGLRCITPWGNEKEKARSERLAQEIPQAIVPNSMTLNQAATMLANANVVVGVDTGLTHFAAALGTNVIALYTATSPGLTGVYGDKNAINLGGAGTPPTVDDVWHHAFTLINPSL